MADKSRESPDSSSRLPQESLGQIIKQQRVMLGLTLNELGAKSGVSSSHLGRIERGERFPSARILRSIAKPLGFAETELFALADFLPSQPSHENHGESIGKLDPYVAKLLSSEPIATQRTLVGILSILKSLAKAD
jgi:transcriptional regulator with XRE-family HTH domain